MTILGTSPALWRCHPRLAPGRDFYPSATGSLWISWPHFSASWMSGTLCLSGVGTHCCALARSVSRRILCPTYAGCVFASAPFWGLCNTSMITCWIKRLLWSAARWMCSGVSIVSCRYGTPAFMGCPSDALWGCPHICIPVAVVAG